MDEAVVRRNHDQDRDVPLVLNYLNRCKAKEGFARVFIFDSGQFKM